MRSKLKPVFEIDLPELGLQRFGDQPGYLLGQLRIAGVDFHVEAIEVESFDDSLRAVDEDQQSKIDHLIELDDANDHQRVNIAGKPHILIIIPFQR